MKVSDSDNLADVLKNLSQYRKGTVGEASEGGEKYLESVVKAIKKNLNTDSHRFYYPLSFVK